MSELIRLRPLSHGVDVRMRRVVGRGERAFERAAEAVVTWRMHRRARIGVTTPDGAPAPRAVPGLRVHVAVGPRALRLGGTCTVLDVGLANEGSMRRAWLTYVTEPDHVEDGVERYVVELADDGTVWGEVEAWSQPRLAVARHLGNLPVLAPHLFTLRYLGAMRHAARH
jgi:uncharacterized protein (UPF0548 family)